MRDVKRMGTAKVDLPPHGYGWGGSNAPAPTQPTLRMRACASQGPMLECGLCEGLRVPEARAAPDVRASFAR